MKYEEVINHIYEIANNNIELIDECQKFIERTYKVHPDKILLLKKENINMSFSDEILLEWIIENYYVMVRIKKNETRLESKLPEGRFSKHHPICYKVINSLNECLEKILNRTNG